MDDTDGFSTTAYVSGDSGTRMPESPDLSIRRVQSYMPDNVSARLSCHAANMQTTAKDREKAMGTIVDKLARLVQGKRE